MDKSIFFCNEIWIHIFSFLPNKISSHCHIFDFLRYRLVCRQWNVLFMNKTKELIYVVRDYGNSLIFYSFKLVYLNYVWNHTHHYCHLDHRQAYIYYIKNKFEKLLIT